MSTPYFVVTLLLLRCIAEREDVRLTVTLRVIKGSATDCYLYLSSSFARGSASTIEPPRRLY